MEMEQGRLVDNSKNEEKRCYEGDDSSESSSSSPPNTNRKRKLNTDSSIIDVVFLLSTGSEQDALSGIVAFLTRADRYKLVETCRGMCRLVETYCRNALAKIAKEHTADDDFMTRLRGSRPEGTSLPYRYLLESAKNTYLYKLDMMYGGSPCRISGRYALGDEGGEGRRRLLAMAATEHLNDPFIESQDPNKCPQVCVHLWDLENSNKSCLWRVEIPSVELEDYEVKGVFFMNDYQYIVTCTSRRLLVCSVASGELIRSYSKSRYIQAVAVRDSNTVIFSDLYRTRHDSGFKLHSFNVVTGESSRDLTQMNGPFHFDLFLLNNRWMVLDTNKVFDIERDYRQVSEIPQINHRGAFEYAGCCGGKPNAFYAYDYDDEQIKTFRVDSETGKVSIESAVDFDLADDQHYRGKLGNCVFLETGRFSSSPSPPTLQVREVCNGLVRRTMTLPSGTRQTLMNYMVHSNGFELFVGVEPDFDRVSAYPHGPRAIIAVYLAGEHY